MSLCITIHSEVHKEVSANTEMSSTIGETILKNRSVLKSVSEYIWSHPELNFEEQYAHDILTDTLEDFGFCVQRHYLLPTAFRAEFDSGRVGPTVAVICEYDALPNIGHACGHNLIAELGLAAGFGIKAAIENDSSVCGKVVVLGTPAEEGGGGKILLIEKGAFKDIDVAMMAHPQVYNLLCPLIVQCTDMTVTYHVKGAIDVWECSNAMDASVICYNNITVLRRSLKPNWRVNAIISPSTAEEAKMRIAYRASDRKDSLAIRTMLKKCIKSAAEMTDCVYNIVYHGGSTKSMVFNKTVVEVFAKHAETKGLQFRDNDPRLCKPAISTDMGNVSHVVPSIHPEYAIGVSPPHVNHTKGFAQAANSEAAQQPTLVVAESLALTALELMSNAQLMTKVKMEFENSPHRDRLQPFRAKGE